MVDLNVYGLWPFAVGLVGWTLAGLVFLARPDRWRNRFAALAIATEPFLMTYGAGWIRMVEDPATASGLVFVSQVAGPAFLVGYLGFLATLDTPLVRPLRHPATPWLVGVAAVGILAAMLAWPETVVRTIQPGELTPLTIEYGSFVSFIQLLVIVVLVYALAVTVSAWRRSDPESPLRERNGWFAAAFGLRDAGVILFVGSLLLTGGSTGVQGLLLLAPVPPLIGFTLLGYGILKTQLFDIDLKIKWTLEKSTIAAIFVAVFFVASEGAQVLFADFVDSEILGVLAAGGLVFFLAPLQRFADKVSDQAMPGVEDTEAYREKRKREVYRASVEELLVDEEITAKERRMLGRLQEELGLEGGEASRIEAAVVEANGGEAA